MTVAVHTTPEADAMIVRASGWWNEHRAAAPHLFDRELAAAIELLARAPDIGRRYRRRNIPGLRRFLLLRTRYHVYYFHDATRSFVTVLAVWSAVRGRGPSLKLP
jgi:plasmid stabilization system protein ParE